MQVRSDDCGTAYPSRRGFLAAGICSAMATTVLSATSADTGEVDSFELNELSITDLHLRLKEGKVTSRNLVEKYLARIEAIDRKGPNLNSVIEINPEALVLAEELDKEQKKSGLRGPLHGIPILIKDNIDTADRMATTAGSLAMVGAKPAKDAFLVSQLRKAGGDHPG